MRRFGLLPVVGIGPRVLVTDCRYFNYRWRALGTVAHWATGVRYIHTGSGYVERIHA